MTERAYRKGSGYLTTLGQIRGRCSSLCAVPANQKSLKALESPELWVTDDAEVSSVESLVRRAAIYFSRDGNLMLTPSTRVSHFLQTRFVSCVGWA